MTPELPEPRKGQLVRDIRSGHEGVVMAEPGVYSSQYWLRPAGGGLEWEAPKQAVELVDAERR